MTSTDGLLLSWKEKSILQNDNRINLYANFNLNQNRKCSNTFSFNQFNSKPISYNNKGFGLQQQQRKTDSKIVEEEKRSNCFGNKSSSNNAHLKAFKSFTAFEKEEKTVKIERWKNDSSNTTTSSSTLSLHIAAYENFIEGDNDTVTWDKTEKFKKDLIIEQKQISLINSTVNLYEFLRQQRDEKINPAVMQFTASQKLFNPNPSNFAKKKRENVNCFKSEMSTTTQTQTSSSTTTSNSNLVPARICKDVCFRFLEGVPEDYRKDNMRVFFEIEMAHWFYMDNYCDNPDFPDCKNIGFKDFSRLIFQHCAYLKSRAKECDKILDEFYLYKQHIPTNGAIMIDKSLEYVLLVQGYFASTNSWGFPKGKVNECEKPIDCAIREVLEETGYDITGNVNEKRSFSRYTNGKALTQLFVATDTDMNFKFEPHANKEIRKIQWFRIDVLPQDRNDLESPARVKMKPNNFYMVVPFVADILQFVKKEKTRRARKAKKDQQQQVNGKINSVSSLQSFTGETFLKMLTTPTMAPASPLPSPSLSSSASTSSEPKSDTILVYTAPVQEKQPKKPSSSSTASTPLPSISPIPTVEETLPPRPASSASQQSSFYSSCEEATQAISKLLNIKPKLLAEHGKSQTQPTLSISTTPQRFSKKSKKSPLRFNSTTTNRSVFY